MRLMATAKELEIMMGISSFRTPYQTHNPKPKINIVSIIQERFSAFFSFSTLMSCGNMEIDVKTPAMIPNIVSFII